MKLCLKFKVLMNGMFPIEPVVIDEFVRKTGCFDESIYSREKIKDDDFPFYLNSPMVKCVYQAEGEKDKRYEFFENDEELIIEIENDSNKDLIQKTVLEYADEKISWLEKRIRLVTNMPIGILAYRVLVYDENKEIITKVYNFLAKQTSLRQRDYTEKMKKQLANRLRLGITKEGWQNIEKNNSRFAKATTFYIESFYIADQGVRFVLLMTALEALFNTDRSDIKKTVAKYSTKMMFVSKMEEKQNIDKIENLYKKRSKYVHGNSAIDISDEDEKSLREIVRVVLIMYWIVSMANNIKSSKEMKRYLMDDNKKVDMAIQIFRKHLAL